MEEDSGISMPQKRQTVVTDDPKITTGDHDKFNPGGPSLMSEGITVNEETMKAEDAWTNVLALKVICSKQDAFGSTFF